MMTGDMVTTATPDQCQPHSRGNKPHTDSFFIHYIPPVKVPQTGSIITISTSIAQFSPATKWFIAPLQGNCIYYLVEAFS